MITDGHIKSYVLRGGRFTDAQQRAYNDFKDAYCINFSETHLDVQKTFGNENPLTVEIGFGMGIATAEIAEANPCKNYLGIEVFRAGIGRLLWEIEERGLKNVRIIEADAVAVIANMIPQSSVSAFHIFFPDPWPKKRHHKRRLVKRPFTDAVASRLVRGGYLYFVTDWDEYAGFALAELTATAQLSNAAAGFSPHKDWRPLTKFEQKGIRKDHEVRELFFVKN